jgi:hypothetical protein
MFVIKHKGYNDCYYSGFKKYMSNSPNSTRAHDHMHLTYDVLTAEHYKTYEDADLALNYATFHGIFLESEVAVIEVVTVDIDFENESLKKLWESFILYKRLCEKGE